MVAKAFGECRRGRRTSALAEVVSTHGALRAGKARCAARLVARTRDGGTRRGARPHAVRAAAMREHMDATRRSSSRGRTFDTHGAHVVAMSRRLGACHPRP